MDLTSVNDLVVRFCNVNGTGSASANNFFAKAIFKMGIPVSPKNIFPSNIQGLPTWYEVRVSEQNHLGRKGVVDIVIGINAQSFLKDIESVRPGGYFIYDNTKPWDLADQRQDITYIGIPMMALSVQHYKDSRMHLLMKNMIYIGALAALLDMELEVLNDLVRAQFARKEKLIPGNVLALELGYNYAKEHFTCPLPVRVERRDLIGDRIMTDGNNACGLGAVFAGATVGSWYPITPSTSVMNSFEKWCKKYRIDPDTGKHNFAVIQSEDELAAIGMVLGAAWNGARAFTATSGPGLSLMNEFLGLAYFAEIPTVLIDVQRSGPSTGMPTRTQQSDLILAAYASHGDTKHILLIPSTPDECFTHTALAFDLAERFQTAIIVMTDLDLGMNDHLCAPFQWSEDRKYDRGKVLNAEQLEAMGTYGRYLDTDGDGIAYRTLPATHPTKGAFLTRGSSRDEYARYTEDGAAYVRNMERLSKKWETAKTAVPRPEIHLAEGAGNEAILYFGTTKYAVEEAVEMMAAEGNKMDTIRVVSFPFHSDVLDFIDRYDRVYVVEQNRDAQMRSLLINELEINPAKLVRLLNYDGSPLTAIFLYEVIKQKIEQLHLTTA
ncbi:MAG TPA: 2-oxoacid:acceptor oxidoreductase subunit alpha [Saprospiraceae bacterium]|nr:2-oxoacid:acceptor oxidoreductase subunit alpha [Saprospiraceae bacterium]